MNFLDRYGGLVTVDSSGNLVSLFWEMSLPAGNFMRPIVETLRDIVHRSNITGVFYSPEGTFGVQENYDKKRSLTWSHMAAPNRYMWTDRIKTAYQGEAEKLEDFKNVQRALGEYRRDTLEQAVQLLESEVLYRSEKVLGPAKWLLDCRTKNTNQLWNAVATAPPGFCHPRASMIGTLLDDLNSGLDFESVKRRFAEKMSPMAYQRPTAAPADQTIEQAEKLVEQLGVAKSLERRFCLADETVRLWTPVAKSGATGVFGHLRQSPPAVVGTDVKAVTWKKFQEIVLPTAESIEYLVQSSANYSAYLTAVHTDSPILFQWDNPVNWYVWHGGSSAEQFSLTAGRYVSVIGITLQPNAWESVAEHQGNGVLFMLEGAKDIRHAGNSLFPETLRSEYHGIRKVIEAYSRKATIHPSEGQHAAGLLLQKNSASSWRGNKFKVTSKGITLMYNIDRWD
ncbi:MAG: hypothetical protein KGI50_05835 [Patescibacteria group bacterium]|nr:hypothetical protein [Patescibacteria group bacterium]MDE2438797.1 hypothetical protein [Patescibacteria group bacterium]